MSFERKQQLFLDAIEESFKFVRLTYARLIETLEAHDPASLGVQPPDALILDCWVIVDLAKRLRTVLSGTPGLRHNAELRRFLNVTGSVPNFRHYIQHLENKAADLAPTGHPIWGSVSWARLMSDKKVLVYTYVPGRLATCKGISVVNPAGRIFHSEIDHVELAMNGPLINLSKLVRNIEKFSAAFCEAVTSAEKSGQRDSNGLIRIEVLNRS